jgi:hypothetical protein
MKTKGVEIMATNKAIFDYDRTTKKRRTDRIYIHESLPLCTHKHIAFDARDEMIKCIYCEMEFWFQSEKQFDKMANRYVIDWNFKTRKQMHTQ